MKRIKYCLYVFALSALLSSCTMQQFNEIVDPHIGKIVGCIGGAIAGAAIKGEKGAYWGCAAGMALGTYYDFRKNRIKEVAKQANMDVAFDEVEVTTIVDSPAGVSESSKLLSSSLVSESMFNSGAISPNVKPTRAFHEMAKAYAVTGAKIMIIGHSDSQGNASFNQRLSEKRAVSIANIFSAGGVDKNDVYYQGVGESQPIASNLTEQGRALNRRVEIVELGASAKRNEKGKTLAQADKAQKLTEKGTDQLLTAYTIKQKENIRNVKYREPESPQRKPPLAPSRTKVLDLGGATTTSKDSRIFKVLGEAEPAKFTFGLFSKAQADDVATTYNCSAVQPAVTGELKKYSSGRAVKHNTAKFLPGMNKSVWSGYISNYYVSIAPVGVLRDNFRITQPPEISIYTVDEKKNIAKNSLFKVNTIAETYEGKHGFLYRLYTTSAESTIECMDIAMPRKAGQFVAYDGEVYYQDGTVKRVVGFKPKRLQI